MCSCCRLYVSGSDFVREMGLPRAAVRRLEQGVSIGEAVPALEVNLHCGSRGRAGCTRRIPRSFASADRAHPNYFLDTLSFINAVRKAIPWQNAE
jgi:hypothetical protein